MRGRRSKPDVTLTSSFVLGGADEKQMELEDETGLEASEKKKSLSSNTSVQDDWGEEYVTRCYCELSHNDEFMIQCDSCR